MSSPIISPLRESLINKGSFQITDRFGNVLLHASKITSATRSAHSEPNILDIFLNSNFFNYSVRLFPPLGYSDQLISAYPSLSLQAFSKKFTPAQGEEMFSVLQCCLLVRFSVELLLLMKKLSI